MNALFIHIYTCLLLFDNFIAFLFNPKRLCMTNAVIVLQW